MISVKKIPSGHGYYFIISTEEGRFQISFEGNLDLYWSSFYEKIDSDIEDIKKITITKENFKLYSLFEKLYEDIKNCNVYELNKSDIRFLNNKEELKKKLDMIKYLNEKLKIIEEKNNEKLFKNDTIEWHSDDSDYYESSILKISKENESFLVMFQRGKDLGAYSSYSVKMSNSCSRHFPFNNVFMKMYNELEKCDFKDNQISIDEYLYYKTLKKEKK